ncbi:N-formylglutamate amidohydrolase [Rhizobium sp. KAs_5_22]|uniref:N-formylglutamate amidohydrolase n=1 Tax=Ciceribacter selenitireducens TaxID=448181 RepID=UPI00048CDAA2|nr:N-formylglutamate amidohydrolase [Ciceribacter selenitireducens]PPJ46089.1 N-formylglutamate amidohydrolase [Rhizobium sp. KAs_5_22]
MLLRSDILTEADGEAVAVENPEGAGICLFVCEHASRRMPERAGNLGLDSDALVSHIAWDPGALDVAKRLSGMLDGPLVYQRFSRLVYDCNRPPESPAAMPERSEIYDIPGNHGLTDAERYARTAALYVPFHDRVSAIAAARSARGQSTVIVTVHSFTPVYMGKQRDVEIGILHDEDSRLADSMLKAADGGPYRVERNEPYGPEDGVTHSLKLHGLPDGHLNVMIEVRNDLIRDEVGQGVVADYLAELIAKAIDTASQ